LISTGWWEDVGAFVNKPLEIRGYAVDLRPLYQEVSKTLTAFIGRVAQGTISALVTVASGAVWVIFILISAFYMVRDAERIIRGLENLAPPGYRDDVVRLRREIARIWNAFLRGQIVLGLVIGVIVTIACTILGLRYPVVLGLLAGAAGVPPQHRADRGGGAGDPAGAAPGIELPAAHQLLDGGAYRSGVHCHSAGREQPARAAHRGRQPRAAPAGGADRDHRRGQPGGHPGHVARFTHGGHAAHHRALCVLPAVRPRPVC
jgi:hypothetical protein